MKAVREIIINLIYWKIAEPVFECIVKHLNKYLGAAGKIPTVTQYTQSGKAIAAKEQFPTRRRILVVC